MLRLLSEYRVHLVGTLCFVVLIRAYRAGDLTELSFWILGVTAAIELAIWAFFRHQFAAHRDDPVRIDYAARRAALWLASAQKGKR